MSNHFTYEIDERKLRVKLKDLEAPQTDDAWQKFETFYAPKSQQRNSDFLRNVQIPLSRNVILPIVFGGIILLFSFLLFNFIDIKNPPKEAIQKEIEPVQAKVVEQPQATQASSTEEPQPKKKEQKPELKLEQPVLPAPLPSQVAKATPSVVQPQEVISAPSNKALSSNSRPDPTPVVPKNVQNVQASTATPNKVTPSTVGQVTATVTTVPARIQSTNPVVSVTKTDTARKQKRRVVPEMVETERTPDARPVLTSDERDAGVRPN